jgi:hypothetical protein
VSPVKYELGFYIAEDDIVHSHCREGLKPYIFHLLFSSFLWNWRWSQYIRPKYGYISTRLQGPTAPVTLHNRR